MGPSNDDLVNRISSILRQEDITGVQLGLVSRLCERMNGDARSCINIMQFLAQSGKLSASDGELDKLLKDKEETVYRVMEEILFEKPKS